MTAQVTLTAPIARTRSPRKPPRGRTLLWAAMLAPSFVLLAVFVLLPLMRGIQLSVYSWDGVAPVMHRQWLGNYVKLWSDPIFYQALGRTVLWWVMHVVLAAGGGLLMAALINEVRWSRFRTTVRSLAFLPQVLSLAVVGVIWSQLYHPTVGLLNQFLSTVGLDALTRPWLGTPELALPAAGLASAWHGYGFYLVIFLASMQAVDPALYEVAKIDGANAWQRFRNVTWPALHNTVSLVGVLAFISALKGFGTVWAMTEGGPARSSELAAVYVWRKAFQSGDIGVASAAGMSIAVLALVITFVFNRWRDRKADR